LQAAPETIGVRRTRLAPSGLRQQSRVRRAGEGEGEQYGGAELAREMRPLGLPPREERAALDRTHVANPEGVACPAEREDAESDHVEHCTFH
jgi:hypothetical protein